MVTPVPLAPLPLQAHEQRRGPRKHVLQTSMFVWTRHTRSLSWWYTLRNRTFFDRVHLLLLHTSSGHLVDELLLETFGIHLVITLAFYSVQHVDILSASSESTPFVCRLCTRPRLARGHVGNPHLAGSTRLVAGSSFVCAVNFRTPRRRTERTYFCGQQPAPTAYTRVVAVKKLVCGGRKEGWDPQYSPHSMTQMTHAPSTRNTHMTHDTHDTHDTPDSKSAREPLPVSRC